MVVVLVVGLRRRQLAVAAQLPLELKQSGRSRQSLSCPDLALAHLQKILPPKMIFRHNFAKHKIETFSDQCLVGIVSDSRDPVSCGTDLALAHLLLTLRQVASLSSCPKCSNETAPFSFPAAPHPQYVPEVDSPPPSS